MTKTLDLSNFLQIILEIERNIRDNSLMLCELDAVIGDGDHGTTLSRGLKNAVDVIESDKPSSISALLICTGNTMIESMGGASGPIFGSLFKDMGKAAEGKEQVTLSDLYDMYERGARKIMKIGQVTAGEKTLMDSLLPALDVLKKSVEKGDEILEAFAQMVEASKAGVENTKNMIATKGRARYAGERSIGHQDAGATSVTLILEATYNSLEKSLNT